MSHNSYELGGGGPNKHAGVSSQRKWTTSPTTRAQRAARRRAELAGSLASSQDDDFRHQHQHEQEGANRWQSISALERSCHFNRLKKGYASVRKSFRLRTDLSRLARKDCEEDDDNDPKRPQVNLVGQMGKLLRDVYRGRARHHQLEADSIASTDGSFKVLAGQGDLNSHQQQHQPIRKSLAELEIEQRLQRARGRVLASASYKAPQSERACDGLNLEELEEMKRDHLRLTLLKGRPPAVSKPTSGGGADTCSCRALDELDDDLGDGNDAAELCCCRSAASSPLSTRSHLLASSDRRTENVVGARSQQKAAAGDKVAGGRPAAAKIKANVVQVDGKLCGGQTRLAGRSVAATASEEKEAEAAQQVRATTATAASGNNCWPPLGGAAEIEGSTATATAATGQQGHANGQQQQQLKQIHISTAAAASPVVVKSRQSLAEDATTTTDEEEDDDDEMFRCAPKEARNKEKHLYASINDSGRKHQWRRLSQDYDQSQLYKRQLEAATGGDAAPKRSLFARLKHLIAPGGNQQQQQPEREDKREEWSPPGSGRRWQKSATLNSRSAQNLMGASTWRAYLSGSRKSINLLDFGDQQPATNKKNLISGGGGGGFLTLGRRGKYSKPAASQLFFAADTNQASRLEPVNSADSLPSADSGLSCGLHLAGNMNSNSNSNSSDEHYATSGNLYAQIAPTKEIEQQMSHRRAIGRARAQVDCNPCAYDKEALVFKRGDIIEILERHQSGTWVGRRGGQVGHFKFINVVELEEREEGGSSPRGGFVTKLEIRNNRIALRPPSPTASSLSLATNEPIKKANFKQPMTTGGRDDEGIMSSLEQLLYAIGLAGEQQQTASESSQSYLDILSQGGVRSLDSFSAINHWHELDRMGISNDEHQRRLLMAARIIRQASMAARVDFVENYRLNRSPTIGDQRLGRQQTNGDAVNEPIYVNLAEAGGIVVVPGERNHAHDLDLASNNSGNKCPPASHFLHARDRRPELVGGGCDSINYRQVADHYRPADCNWRGGAQAKQRDSFELSDDSEEEADLVPVTGRSPLVRGYSVRRPQTDLTGGHQHHHIYEDPRQPLMVAAQSSFRPAPSQRHPQPRVSRIVRVNPPLAPPSPPPPAPMAACRRLRNVEQPGDDMIPDGLANCQFNSRSAYDLRLDLSHFFS